MKDTITIDPRPWAMNWKTGKMEVLNERPELPEGTRVEYHKGHAQLGIFALLEDGKTCVNMYGNYEDAGAFCELDKYAKTTSEVFGIGTYYDPSAAPFTAKEIARAVEQAKFWEEEQTRKRAEEERAREAKREETRAKFAGKYPERKGGCLTDAVQVAKNIRQDLAEAFPGQKFSVRKEDYDTISVNWEDGPTREEVERVCKKWQRDFAGNLMEDYYATKDNIFTSVFGGVDYLHISRHFSAERLAEMAEELRAACPELPEAGKATKWAHPCEFAGLHGFLSAHNAEITREGWWTVEEVARIVVDEQSYYTRPAAKETKPAQVAEMPEGGKYQIIDYSEKAIAVTGDTKAIKDTLRQMGGKFNARLSCGPGWIFSRRKEQDLRALLSC